MNERYLCVWRGEEGYHKSSCPNLPILALHQREDVFKSLLLRVYSTTIALTGKGGGIFWFCSYMGFLACRYRFIYFLFFTP